MASSWSNLTHFLFTSIYYSQPLGVTRIAKCKPFHRGKYSMPDLPPILGCYGEKVRYKLISFNEEGILLLESLCNEHRYRNKPYLHKINSCKGLHRLHQTQSLNLAIPLTTNPRHYSGLFDSNRLAPCTTEQPL